MKSSHDTIDEMQMASLKVFCDVVRLRNLSEAGAANHLTQSAVSHIVSQLEHQLDVQLLDRSTRPVGVTPLGERFFEGCKGILEQYAELETEIRAANLGHGGSVRVAAIYSVGLGDMGQFVHTFEKQHPDAEILVEYLHPDRVYERVHGGLADIGLVSFPEKSSKLTTTPWREEEMVVVCGPGHALARLRSVAPRLLDGETLVHFDANLVVRRRIDRMLKEQGVSVTIGPEFDNIENIKQAVAVGAGIALLPEPTVRREVRMGTLAALPLAGVRFVRPLAIVTKRGHWLGAAARAFLDLIQGKEAGEAHAAPADAPAKRKRNRLATAGRGRD